MDSGGKRASLPRMGKTFAVLFLMVVTGQAQTTANITAYDALRSVGTQLGRDAVNRVISLSGTDGNPQPRTWRIFLAEGSGVRQVTVTDGRVSTASAGAANPTKSATIDTTKLNLDSSGAYEVASKTADTSHIPFSLVSYTLRSDEHGNPTWVVNLQNANRRSLGTIFIGANKGTVSRTEGMFQGLPSDAVLQEKPSGEIEYSSSGRLGPIKDRARGLFGHARDQARETFKRVRHNFADYIRGSD